MTQGYKIEDVANMAWMVIAQNSITPFNNQQEVEDFLKQLEKRIE